MWSALALAAVLGAAGTKTPVIKNACDLFDPHHLRNSPPQLRTTSAHKLNDIMNQTSCSGCYVSIGPIAAIRLRRGCFCPFSLTSDDKPADRLYSNLVLSHAGKCFPFFITESLKIRPRIREPT